MGQMRNALKEKSEGRRWLGRPRCRCNTTWNYWV